MQTHYPVNYEPVAMNRSQHNEQTMQTNYPVVNVSQV